MLPPGSYKKTTGMAGEGESCNRGEGRGGKASAATRGVLRPRKCRSGTIPQQKKIREGEKLIIEKNLEKERRENHAGIENRGADRRKT